MTIVTNTTDRKSMVKAMAKALDVRSRYVGPPSYAFEVGPYTVDRQGNIHGDDFEALRDFLQENGYTPEGELPEPEAQTEPEAKNVDSEAPTELNVSVPADDMSTLQLKNLILMLYALQYLIGKMTGGDTLRIPDTLAARLSEKTPDTLADFEPLLRDAREEHGMTGFDFGDGKVTVTYPLHPDEPELNMVYSMLTARILKAAKQATRVTPERQEPENEKYFCRAWLLRLGYGGAAMKVERNLLLKPLKGCCAFSNDEKAAQHREKYAAIRKQLKADAQGVTENE